MTYHTHHEKKLRMNSCKSDKCVLYRRSGTGSPDAVRALQVDDVYGHGDDKFLDDEERESKRFQSKPRVILQAGDCAFFNRCRIAVDKEGAHTLGQEVKLKKLELPKTKEDLIGTRAVIHYIGSCTRPDLCAPAQLMSSAANNPDEETFKELKKIVRWCHETSGIGLRFVPLEQEQLRVMLFTDASFANAKRLKSQLGFVVALADGTGKGNIVHYGSTTCRRIARSVMAAELHALVNGFDNAFMARDMLKDLLGKEINIDAYVDSRTVFNVIAKQSKTLEKRLQIDVNALRQSYHNGELRNMAWIPGSQNIADGLTKGLINKHHPLWRLMTENKVQISREGWVETEHR